MREILFRGKRTGGGEWVYGWYTMGCFGRWPLKDCIIPSQLAIDGELRSDEVDPSTVGQYTGLTDKNGKKIFEGDIISVEFEEDSSPECGMPLKWCENYIVAFDEVHHCWGTKISDMEDGEWLYEYDDGCATVIGNIHDNPELLKEAAND